MLSSGPLRLALLCALLAVGAMVGTTAASDPPASPNPPASPSHRASSEPRCFGAASLDPSKPCHNPRLGRLVVPPPAVAGPPPHRPVHGHRRRGLAEALRIRRAPHARFGNGGAGGGQPCGELAGGSRACRKGEGLVRDLDRAWGLSLLV